jgi:hypothetical protein
VKVARALPVPPLLAPASALAPAPLAATTPRYALSVFTKSSASGATLHAKVSGGTTKSVVIPSTTSWTNVTLSGIAISGGQVEVGIASSGQTVKLDDFSLISEWVALCAARRARSLSNALAGLSKSDMVWC